MARHLVARPPASYACALRPARPRSTAPAAESASFASAWRAAPLPPEAPPEEELRERRNQGGRSRVYLETKPNEASPMTMTLSVGPVIALIAGILILVMPRLLNYIVALYLIVIGLLGLFSHTGHI